MFRAESGRVISILVADCGDIQLAEDALQDACAQASKQWLNNPPKKPAAWLLTVARRRLIDRLRKASTMQDLDTLQYLLDCLKPNQDSNEHEHDIPDERLKLIFTCCHPALKQHAQVALTLKTICGLSVREIARAYLVSESTMNQRILRAKNKIKTAGIAYKVPEKPDLAKRLEPVLATIYLIYNESYVAFEGQSLTRDDLANEAIRLAQLLYTLLPNAEVGGLLSLMLLHQSRRDARLSHNGQLVPLEHQERSVWNQQLIEQGVDLLTRCLAQGNTGPYQLQASISALHAQAPNWAQTDWPQIQLIYLELYRQSPSPVVKLNGLVAMAHSGEIERAHQLLEQLSESLVDYQPFYVAKADMLSKLDQPELAKQNYDKAIKMSQNDIERTFLLSQRDKLQNH